MAKNHTQKISWHTHYTKQIPKKRMERRKKNNSEARAIRIELEGRAELSTATNDNGRDKRKKTASKYCPNNRSRSNK